MFDNMKSSVLLLLVSAILSACATPPPLICEKDNTEHLIWDYSKEHYNNTWWQLYQRGLAYKDCGEYDKAKEDLKESKKKAREALKKRWWDKNDISGKDGWRFETTENRYTDYDFPAFRGYFPRRELGIIYFKQGFYKEAVQSLSDSIKQKETKEAVDCLIQATKAWIKNYYPRFLPPAIELSFPNLEEHEGIFYTNNNCCYIKIDIDNPISVQSITINGMSVQTGQILAKNCPQIINGVSELHETIHLNERVELKTGRQNIEVIITDLLGNSYSSVPDSGKNWEVVLDVTPPTIGYWFDPYQIDNGMVLVDLNILDNELIDLISQDTWCMKNRLRSWPLKQQKLKLGEKHPILIKDVAGNEYSFYLTAQESRSDDILELQNEAQYANKPVYLDKIFIKGTLYKKVKNVSIAGKTVFHDIDKTPFNFIYSLPLTPGKHIYKIECADKNGLKQTKPIEINCKSNEVTSVKGRLKVYLVADMPDQKKYFEALFRDFYKILTSNNRFNIVGQKLIPGVNSKNQRNKFIDLGTIEDAEAVLLFSTYQKKTGIELNAELIDIDTHMSFLSINEFSHENANKTKMLEYLEWQIRHKYPLIQGNIIDLKEKQLRLDRGISDGLIKLMKINGYSLDKLQDDELLEGKVEEVGFNDSIANITGKSAFFEKEDIGRFITR